MKILLVGDYPADPRLGSAKVYFRLREALRARGHHCDVMLAPEIGGGGPARLRWATGPWIAARAVVRAFRAAGGYDVIDVASAEALGVAAARRAGLLPGARVVARSHGLEHRNYARMLEDARHGLARKPWFRRGWYPLARLTQVAAGARAADALVVLNPEDADFAVRRGWQPPARVHRVGHGGAPPAPEGALDTPRGGGVLFCGSWDPVKGVPYLVDAFARLAGRAPEARLTVLGPGPAPEVVLGAFPAAVRDRVRVLPRAAEEEVVRHFRAHDVLAHPSTFEGFGMAVLEAMGQGLPVVATPVGCAAELVRDGVTGWSVPPRDAEALAAALLHALRDPAEARRRARAGWAAARGRTWADAAERLESVYRGGSSAR